ncbi:MAG: hypothetical protein L0170_15875, partial [Acidobacteria bacterium]|nr:hypothetical protein [Acidobacteriota bacterium]
MSRKNTDGDRTGDFSFVEGGPLYAILLRCHLVRFPVGFLGRRMAALVLLPWAPLFILSAAGGELHDGVAVPFLRHLAVHARFLISLPLLLIAEVVVHYRVAVIVRQFTAQGLIPPAVRSRFDEAVTSSHRLSHAAIPEIILALVAFTASHWFWIKRIALPIDTWYGHRGEEGISLTAAGTWYAFVSLPLFRFILYRWYFRLAVWYRFLWKVSRLPLNLNPLHPDRAAGLGFLSESVWALTPVLVAHTVALSGLIGDQIWHRGLTLAHFKLEIGLVLGLLMILVLLPLMFFSLRLSKARQAALREQGILAARYVGDFNRKWIRHSGPKSTSPLGSADIQALADLGHSFDVVRQTRPAPFGKRTVLML